MQRVLQKLSLLLCTILITACAATKTYIDPPKELPPPREIKNVKVALVLGGGGAKGVAHLGIIDVLEKHGVPIDLIVGTSSGSIVGAMYADYQDSALLYDNLISLKKWDLLDFSFLDSINFFSDLRAPFQGYFLQNFMVKNLTVTNMEDLKIPFVAVATDLTEEKPYRMSSGPIAIAVNASAAIPPFLRPVEAYGKLLVDGGVVEPVPVETAKLYKPDVIIAVDISTPGKEYSRRTMYDVTLRSLYISYYILSLNQSKAADILIHPDCSGIGLFDDDDKYKIFMIGRQAALQQLPAILAKLKEKKIPLKTKL